MIGQPQVATPRLRRVAWWLTIATIGWNVIEAIVAVASGVVASSIALIGFGLDSSIEVSSALVIVWLLSHPPSEATERVERRAVRLIAMCFFVLAIYLVLDAVARLLGIGLEPAESVAGLVLTALSLVVMPSLAWAKRRVALAMGSVSLKADSNQTLLCAYLSAIVFVGLGANALAGWWWMDPLAALGVAAIAVREGWEAWRSGDLCC